MSLRGRLPWLAPALLVLAACQIPGAPVALDDFHVATSREGTEVEVLANDHVTGSEPTIQVTSGPSCGELLKSTTTVVVVGIQNCPEVITLSYMVIDEFGMSGEANVEIELPNRSDEGQDDDDDEGGEWSLISNPASVDFGEVESETTGRRTVTFENGGSSAVEVFEVVTTPDTEFGVGNSDCETVIEPGAHCFVDLIFTPSAELRVHQGVLGLLDKGGATLASVELIGRTFVATTMTTGSTTSTSGSTTSTSGSTTSTSIPWGGCVDFEDLPPGASFRTGEDFETGDVDVVVSPFRWSDGRMFDGGEVVVGAEGLAGGTENELFTNNVLLRFGFPSEPLDGLSLDFGAHGGNLNIELNREFRNFGGFDEIDGTVIGGVSVSVFSSESGGVGSLVLTGAIHEFAIGGQEFAIDNLCA